MVKSLLYRESAMTSFYKDLSSKGEQTLVCIDGDSYYQASTSNLDLLKFTENSSFCAKFVWQNTK